VYTGQASGGKADYPKCKRLLLEATSWLATIAAQDQVKISENSNAALAKKRAAGVQLGAPTKSTDVVDQVRQPKAAWRLFSLAAARAIILASSFRAINGVSAMGD